MGKGAKGANNDWNKVAEYNAYNAAKGGSSLADINANQSEYGEANQSGFDRWGREQAQNQQMEGMFNSMMSGGDNGDKYAAQMKSQQEAASKAAEDARLQGLISQRDAYIGAYNEAANTATSYVTSKMDQEKTNAALMGVDYNVTDEQKTDRINNYFSSIWSEGNQKQLESSFAEVGNGGFTQSVFRGKGTEGAGAGGGIGKENKSGTITPVGGKPKPSLMGEDNLGGAVTALGGA